MRPPLCCYKDQRFGHVAVLLLGKRRCKCGEDHEEVPKCCNCGGDLVAAFRGCKHFVQARQVQIIRDQYKV